MSPMEARLAVAFALAMVLPAAAAAQAADSASDALIAQGREIYAGKAGGALCVTCHGPAAKGMQGLGPDLTDDAWLHGDGGFTFLQTIVQTGVMNPKRSATIMPPMGGGKLTAAQLAALAAYLGSLR